MPLAVDLFTPEVSVTKRSLRARLQTPLLIFLNARLEHGDVFWRPFLKEESE